MTDTLADLTSELTTYVVAPLNAFGLGGFVFDVRCEERALLTAEITDHYTEDNKALQDHIAIRPKRITLKGYVGELIYNSAGQSPTIVQTVTQKLTQLSAFLPAMGAAATQAQAAIASVSGANASGTGTLDALAGAVPAAANIYGLVTNLLGTITGDTKKQQSAYQYFSACQSTGILMGIQTPWEFLTNMAIETIDAIQTEDSVFVTDFSITFKQIRIANSLSVAASPLSGTGTQAPTQTFSQAVADLQRKAVTNLGPIPGSPSIVSLSNPANNSFVGVF